MGARSELADWAVRTRPSIVRNRASIVAGFASVTTVKMDHGPHIVPATPAPAPGSDRPTPAPARTDRPRIVSAAGLAWPGPDRASPPTIRRRVIVNSSDGQQSDLIDLLAKRSDLGIDPSRGIPAWYASFKDRIQARFGYDRFAGYIRNTNPDYELKVTLPVDLANLRTDHLTTGVVGAINQRVLSLGIEKGHSSIGNMNLLGRSSFAAAIKNSFDKVPVIAQVKSDGGGLWRRDRSTCGTSSWAHGSAHCRRSSPAPIWTPRARRSCTAGSSS